MPELNIASWMNTEAGAYGPGHNLIGPPYEWLGGVRYDPFWGGWEAHPNGHPSRRFDSLRDAMGYVEEKATERGWKTNRVPPRGDL